MKNHEYAALLNELRSCAMDYAERLAKNYMGPNRPDSKYLRMGLSDVLHKHGIKYDTDVAGEAR